MPDRREIMTIRNILNLISLGLLFYLLIDSFMHFDIAATKNNALNRMHKSEIDSTQSILLVKQKAKGYIDAIRKDQREYGAQTVINFMVITGLMIIQLVLLFIKTKRTVTTDHVTSL